MTNRQRDLDQARRALMPWLWTATVFAMLTSLGSGTELMMRLGNPIYIALLFPLASDVGLIASLRGTAKLSEHGLTEGAASALRWFSAVFCLALNCTGSMLDGSLTAAGFHAGIPILVVILAVFEERYANAFARLIAAERAAAVAAPVPVAPAVEETVSAPNDTPVTAVPAKRVVRTDDELLPLVNKLIDERPAGVRVGRRDVQSACKVGPKRATALLTQAYDMRSRNDSGGYL